MSPEQRVSAVIVDDEELARSVLKEHLAAHPEVDLLAECANGFEAVKTVNELKPGLIFLDIQMPKLDGFEVLELLDPRPTVVFVTAYDQHALRAFEIHAVDYLLKPFPADRFEEALQRAKARIGGGESRQVQPTDLSASAKGDWPLDRIVVRDGAKVTFIPLAKLDFIQAQDDYVLLKTPEKGHLKQQTLASLETQLDASRFIRIHRSYILNLDRLVRVEQDSKEHRDAILRDGTRLPVSRAGFQRLRELWEGA